MDYSIITALGLSNKKLTKLPDDIHKYTNLKNLDCAFNQIATLYNLPPTLTYLNCADNQIATLDNLPSGLTYLVCYKNSFIYDFEPTLKNIRTYHAEN